MFKVIVGGEGFCGLSNLLSRDFLVSQQGREVPSLGDSKLFFFCRKQGSCDQHGKNNDAFCQYMPHSYILPYSYMLDNLHFLWVNCTSLWRDVRAV